MRWMTPPVTRCQRSYNTLLAAYVKGGRGRAAMKLLRELEQEGFRPDLISYNTVLKALANDKRVGWSFDVEA
jgi:pentatricopeptide repeat protein